jgi:hypothetical protein
MASRAIAALFLFLLFVVPAKADEFDFTFQTTNGSLGGSGFFDTPPYGTAANGQPEAYAGFQITSLDGTVNGTAMDLVSTGAGSRMDYEGPVPPVLGVPLTLFGQDGGFNFLNGNLDFTLDGQLFVIHDVDMGPPSLIGLDLWNGTTNMPITMTVIPVATPEPSTLLSCLIGLSILGLAFRSRRTNSRQT